MRKRLDSALAKLRRLPKSLQNKAAAHLLEYVNEGSPASERFSIAEAREAYSNGDFLTLSKWKNDLGLADD
jgi:hypothetical protein